MEWKTIIILAKSYKKGHWCFAGRELVKNSDEKYEVLGWIRPVSSDEDSQGSVFNEHSEYTSGEQAKVFDIVRIPFESHSPSPGQPENWLIDECEKWELISHHGSGNASYFQDAPKDLWLELGIETDRISLAYEATVPIVQSLNIIKPEEFYVTLSNELDTYEVKYKRHITADFIYNGTHYEHLSITDPKVRRMLRNQYPGEGEESKRIRLNHIDEYRLCVSLGPRFGKGDRHYKFVATIFDNDGYIQRTY